jgi:alpha-ribazole phosphatase
MQFTLIRHTSVAVSSGVCYGQSDVPVSASFYNEAEIVFGKLQNNVFDVVYTSPLSRCTVLAHHCGFSAAQTDSRLMELHFGNWEMKKWDEIDDPHLSFWFDNWQTAPTSNGESFQQLIERVRHFTLDIKKQYPDNTRIALITHAGVIRALGILSGLFAPEKAFEYPVNYGDIVEMSL